MVVFRTQKRSKVCRGLSLPEMMISLAITTTLLVAVAAAFSASANAIDLNDTFFRSTQAARVSMNQILGEIRNCSSVDVKDYTNGMKITRTIPLNGLTGYYSATQNSGGSYEASRMFMYDTAGQRLTMQINYADGTSSPVYELATNVTACSFGPVPAADYVTDANQTVIPKHVPIQITVQVGSNTITLNGSAAPRVAMQY